MASGSQACEAKMRRGEPLSWWNQGRRTSPHDCEARAAHGAEVDAAADRFERFAPLVARLFPETAATGGLIRSSLLPADRLAASLGLGARPGRLFVKGDHDLPIAGSIKARGGIHAVLAIAEEIAQAHGLLGQGGTAALAEPEARAVFAAHRISVGSTGNLVLSVGTVASALGFAATVHMSLDAKDWKKRRLRERGVEVVEHVGDYAEALAAARSAAARDPACTFIDDEGSRPLLYGYAVAARELAAHLDAAGIRVDDEHRLVVHLPCGVGGAPAGIALGLHLIYGGHVHCFFAEPVESPCFTLAMMSGDGSHPSVYDAGLTGRTEADGLAVPRASPLAAAVARPIVAGTDTVTDAVLLRNLYHAAVEGLRLEPSAAAGLGGPSVLRGAAQDDLRAAGLAGRLSQATEVVWTTGGRLMPEEAHRALAERGRALHRTSSTKGECA